MQTQQLIKDCLNNNRQAQQQLYNLYAANMLGLCYRYTKSLHDAEDVLQEGFVKVFTQLRSYKGEGELGAWIRRIMVNTAITYIKKHNKYKIQFDEEAALHIVSPNEPDVTINEKDLVECIRQLPITQQTIFNLVAIEGYSQVEVAELLNININTIRSHFNRSKNALIRMIENEQKIIINKHINTNN